MKKIKKMLLALSMLLMLGSTSTVFAQETSVGEIVSNPKSYWQLASRVGYDFPMFKEDFKYIAYKGGIMGGLSLNKYWNRWGVQLDFDYIKNTPAAAINNPNYIGIGATNLVIPMQISTTKKDITRLFFGVGPAYKYQSESNKFTVEFAVLGGLGRIDGGEILVEGNNSIFVSPKLLTYHSGFDNQIVPTLKGQIRATYFFNENWGANFGVYYMNHFGVEESQKNQILIHKGYLANNTTSNAYFYEMGTNTVNIDSQNGLVAVTAFSEQSENEIERFKEGERDDQQKIQLQSIGVFAGLTYKFSPTKKPKKIVEEVVKKEEEKPIEKKYCVQITAKDKFTKEVLPNTDVALKNSKGEVIGTAKTDAFGITKFCDILPDDYNIEGVFNEIALEKAAIAKSEFKENLTIQKEILYADKNLIIKGKAVECNTTTPVSGLNVILENTNLAFKKSTISDEKGNFILQMPATGIYSLYGKKENYFSQTEEVNVANYDREKTLFVKIEICAEKADCGKAIGLKNILFDLAKFNIREDAKPELNKLVRFMQDNPDVKVEVGSHTDCRSSHKYNQTLSQNRANASVAYIVSQGIAKERITAKGYGETKLLNECADGISCTEEQHQTNRRTEFKVICPEKK